MGFVKFSSDFLMETFTLVDNLFITEHLQYCDEKQVKAYLYGLYLCNGSASDNSVDAICARFDMSESEVLSTYKFFEDLGLCRIISANPLQVEYLCLKRCMQPPKKYRSEKWADFNAHLQQLFPERQITPNEYNEYYLFLEESKLSEEAMLMIVQYCINMKGQNVRYPYILTVARNWIADGARSIQDVEDKLKEYDNQSEQMREVLSALGRKGSAELEDKQMLLKWTRSWGFDLEAILAAAKTLKSGKSFAKLDARLDEFYRMSVFTAEQMRDWQKRRDELRDIAVAVNKNLGVYYESFEHEIEVYVVPWTSRGFDAEALKKLAHHCFITNIRTLEGMNNVVNKFYQMGLLTAKSIDEYLEAQIKGDARIKKILEACGLTRAVTAQDREAYKVWTAGWGFDEEVILYAASQAVGRTYPIPYVNQLLSQYKAQGVTNVEGARKLSPEAAKSGARDYEQRSYTKEELRSIITSIDSLDEEDI